MNSKHRVWSLFFCLFLPLWVWSQTGGTIRGVVVDEKGNPVSQASVHIAEKGPSAGHRLVQYYSTDGSGQFTIRQVPWGTYVVLAGKQDDGYPDTGLAFYSNLEVPTVVLAPLFPDANATVRFGPKAATIEIASVVDAANGKSVQQSSSVTLRRVDRPDFSITTSASAKPLLVPSLTNISIELDAAGYRQWPNASDQPGHEVRLQPGEVRSIDVRLQPTSSDPTILDLLKDLSLKNNRIFTIEEARAPGEPKNSIRAFRTAPPRKRELISALNYMRYTVPNFAYQVDKNDPRVIHVKDSRLDRQKEYGLDKVAPDIDFTASVASLTSTISTGGVLILQMPASDDLLNSEVGRKVTIKLSGASVRDALSRVLQSPEQSGILWMAETELGPEPVTVVRLCCAARPK